MSASHPAIEVQLKYLSNDMDEVLYIASTGGGDVTEHQGNYVMKSVQIHNARIRDERFSLDTEGFALVAQSSKVSDFYDDDEIQSTYEAEVKHLLCTTLAATQVEIFDHTRRASSLAVQKSRQIREPAGIIHNDFTAKSGPIRLRDHFSDRLDQLEDLLQQRFAIVNVWRSIGGTVYNAPLAFCDASSLRPEHLVSVERQSNERIGEIQLALYDTAHRGYYFPEMSSHEALLFKTYDSATDGRARFTIHSAFDDPSASAGAPPRESIETRCFVFFE